MHDFCLLFCCSAGLLLTVASNPDCDVDCSEYGSDCQCVQDGDVLGCACPQKLKRSGGRYCDFDCTEYGQDCTYVNEGDTLGCSCPQRQKRASAAGTNETCNVDCREYGTDCKCIRQGDVLGCACPEKQKRSGDRDCDFDCSDYGRGCKFVKKAAATLVARVLGGNDQMMKRVTWTAVSMEATASASSGITH